MKTGIDYIRELIKLAEEHPEMTEQELAATLPVKLVISEKKKEDQNETQ